MHSILQDKGSGDNFHIAHYRLLPSLFARLRIEDPNGIYDLKTEPSADGERFVSLFVVPSAHIRNARNFEAVASVDCAHLRTVTQGQLCTLSAYDANKNLAPLAFSVFKSETAANWERFINMAVEVFPPLQDISI